MSAASFNASKLLADRQPPPHLTLLAELPLGYSLDGELYLGRNRFDETSGVVRTTKGTAESDAKWKQLKFMVRAPPLPSRPALLKGDADLRVLGL